MTLDSTNIIEETNRSGAPQIGFIKRVQAGKKLGVFASSFNPPTLAHVELIRRAANTFALDEILALAGSANADKMAYECSLNDRLAMLSLTFAAEPRVSVGLSSHAFYVDMIDGLERAYPGGADLHFIVGFDTFERVLDAEHRYTERYHRKFAGRTGALNYLFAHSRLIVARRAGEGLSSVMHLVEHEASVPRDRVLYLDFPADLGDLSATEARKRCREGKPLHDIVPGPVEDYIREHALYT